jgi:hypothetical protein
MHIADDWQESFLTKRSPDVEAAEDVHGSQASAVARGVEAATRDSRRAARVH